MKLVDMKLAKKTKESSPVAVSDYESQEKWPYGLQISFEKEQIEKLPYLNKFKVGDKILVSGEGTVTSVSMHERKNGNNNQRIEIQLELVDVNSKNKKAVKDMTPSEYREFRKLGKI